MKVNTWIVAEKRQANYKWKGARTTTQAEYAYRDAAKNRKLIHSIVSKQRPLVCSDDYKFMRQLAHSISLTHSLLLSFSLVYL